MLFNSYEFLIFLPIVLMILWAIPDRFKNTFLLVASYFFYMNWNPIYGFLLLLCTAVTYISAISIGEKFTNRPRIKKKILIGMLIIIFGILFYYKYFTMVYVYSGKILSHIGLNLSFTEKNIILPVGISFFTFQSVAYVIDVYRGDVRAEKNFIKYALFISFFPQLVAGPIERSRNLLKQLNGNYRITVHNVKEGLLIILWGYFLKIVIADRAAIFVDAVYDNIALKSSLEIIIATVLFAFQIYGDFGGYSLIAKGIAKLMGISIMDNFNSPYISLSVREFWRRWHISLNTWFTDYLYIPLGGSQKGQIRTYFNTMIVFLLSGLWHGAGLTFVLWGMVNGIYVIFEKITKIKKCTLPIMRIVQGIVTFILVDFAWMFFRSQGIYNVKAIFARLYTGQDDFDLHSCFLNNGLNMANMILLLIAIIFMMCVDYYSKDGKRVRTTILKQPFAIQSMVVISAILVIMIFGIWGNEYDAANFIYFRF